MTEADPRRAFAPPQSFAAFEIFCHGADLVSSVWQPMLKAVGRYHLEVAGLGVKNAQAVMQLSRDLTRCYTPSDVASANIRYWDSVAAQCAQSSQRLAAQAVQTVAVAVDLDVSEIVPLKVKARDRDFIVLPTDIDVAHGANAARKVA